MADMEKRSKLTNRNMLVPHEVCRPLTFNAGASLVKGSEEGTAVHHHFDAVPRWAGFVDFMTSIMEPRAIFDSLDKLYPDPKSTWVGLHGSDLGDCEHR